MKKRLVLLLVSLSLILSLSGCSGGGGGGDFDIVAFLYKPYIAIPLALLIVYWMMKRSK